MNLTSGRWQFYIDRGGTFTDVVARAPSGEITVHKLLSTNPEQYSDAAIEGIRRALDIVPEEFLPPDLIGTVRMGTTVGTNALLERKGDRCALLITKGFGDVLRIGYQNRPDLFALRIKLPEKIYEQVHEIDERIDTSGNILVPLDPEEIRIKPAFKTMRPLDPTNEIIGSKIPIAFSRQLIAEHKPGSSKDRFLVSSDGTVCGRFLALRGGFTWSFQLLSPEQRFVRKVLFSMKEENTVFQSNDLGSVELVSWTGSPEDVGAVEIIPYVDNVVYSTPGICSKAELPISIELNGELTGKINVEQEEGDNGESVLHFYLSELPHQFFSQQVIIAFSDSYRRSYIEESIGRDIYLYGPDLFRDFQLWIYIR